MNNIYIKISALIFLYLVSSCANTKEFYLSDITIPIRHGETEKASGLISKHKSQLDNPKYLFELIAVSIKSNNQKIFNLLQDFNFDFNNVDEHGRSLLIHAASQENLYYLNVILSNEVNIEHKENDRDTAFSVAAATYNLAAMKLLIKHGAKDLDSHANNTAVPLNVAVAHQDIELVEMMLVHGADANHQYEFFYKKYPLQIAIEKNNPEIVKLLLKHKADPNKLTCYGETPLYLAQGGYKYDKQNADPKQKQIVALLKSYKAQLPKIKPRNRATSGSFRRPGC